MSSKLPSRRGFLFSAGAVAALALFPASAFAFASSGNLVADMAYTINRNRGLAHGLANQLAMGVGTVAAGGSVWTRILRRTPLKRLFLVANLGSVAYWIYSEVSGAFFPTGQSLDSHVSQGRVLGELPVYGDPIYDRNAALRAISSVLQPNQYARIQYVGHSGQAPAEAGKTIDIVVFSRWMPTPEQSGVQYINGDGVWVDANTGLYLNNSTTNFVSGGINYQLKLCWAYYSPSLIWRWTNLNLPNDLPRVLRPTHPDEVPRTAVVPAQLLADELNENYERLRQSNPDWPAIEPYTAAEVSAVASEPALTVEKLRPTLQVPISISDPDAAGGTGGTGEGGTGGTGGLDPSSWGEPAPVVMPDDLGLPDLPEAGEISARSGVPICPPFPNGSTFHCGPLESSRSALTNTARALGAAATFALVLRD